MINENKDVFFPHSFVYSFDDKSVAGRDFGYFFSTAGFFLISSRLKITYFRGNVTKSESIAETDEILAMMRITESGRNYP